MGEKIIAGLIAIGLITAVGLHSTQLAKLAPPVGKAGSGLLHTAETGAA
jgi:hypothetical protein